MRNLLRCLSLAVLLLPALASVAPAKPLSTPTREICINGGSCSVSHADCVIRADCPIDGERCVC